MAMIRKDARAVFISMFQRITGGAHWSADEVCCLSAQQTLTFNYNWQAAPGASNRADDRTHVNRYRASNSGSRRGIVFLSGAPD
jgi:hypothetical protein